MKVRDLLKQLSHQDPDDEVVMKHLYTSPEIIMKKIRVYPYRGRVIVDGYEQENSREDNGKY
tara:strand:- start:210 stop:395 length:186 start_codon:yes stop_codon:yes gene_type:complete